MMPRRVAIAVSVAALTACSGQPTPPTPSPTVAPPPRAEATTTALLVSAPDAATQLSGSDGKVHLEYDLTLQNVFDAPVTVTAIEVLDAAGRSLLTMDEKKVAAYTRPVFTGAPTAVVPVSGVLATVMDVAVAPDAVPEALTHRIRYRPADSPNAALVGTRDIAGPDVVVAQGAPVTIGPPLRGNEWLATNSCCAPEAPHRNTTLAVGGNTLRRFEEFGVDWIRLRGGKFFEGDLAHTEDWFTTGADLVAVADGTVTSTRDGMPNQTPDTPVTGLTKPLDYPGNSVILQIAPTVWAVYAHALPGTVAVKPGDHVIKGQVIGKLGNSGNSGAPHLHFQLSDGPDPIDSNSVPFALESYWLAGTVDPKDLSADNPDGEMKALPIRGASGQQTRTYPLTYTVVTFP